MSSMTDPVEVLAAFVGDRIRSGASSDERLPVVTAELVEELTPTPMPRMTVAGRSHYLLVLEGPRTGELYRLERGDTIVGRSEDAGIRLTEGSVSRRHARLSVSDEGLFIEDLGSANGTFCNGQRVTSAHVVEDGEIVTFGSVTMVQCSGQGEEDEVFRQRMLRLGARDPVTLTLKPAYLYERLRAEHSLTLRRRTPLAVLVVDIDLFAAVNEIYGRQGGDSVLKETAAILRRTIRREDFVCRLDSDRFGIVSRGTHTDGAMRLGDRLRTSICQTPFPYGGRNIPITVSIGVAVAPSPRFERAEDMINAAAVAAKTAKISGRDRVAAAPGG